LSYFYFKIIQLLIIYLLNAHEDQNDITQSSSGKIK